MKPVAWLMIIPQATLQMLVKAKTPQGTCCAILCVPALQPCVGTNTIFLQSRLDKLQDLHKANTDHGIIRECTEAARA